MQPNSSKKLIIPDTRQILGSIILFGLFFAGCNSVANDEATQEEQPYRIYAKQIQDAYFQSDFIRADSLITYFYALADSTGDRRLAAAVSLEHSFARLVQTRNYEAEEILFKYRDDVMNSGDQRMRLNWYIRASSVMSVTNRGEMGLELIRQVEAEVEQSESIDIKTAYYSALAIVYKGLNRFPEALQSYYRAILLMNENGIRNSNLATIYNNVALILHETGQYEEALISYADAYAVNTELNNMLGLATNLNNISNSLTEIGMLQAAVDTLRAAIRINENQPPSPMVIRNYYNMGLLLGDLGQYEASLDYFIRGYALSASARFQPGMMFHANGKAIYYEKRGDFNSSIRWTREALELAEQSQHLQTQGDSWKRIAVAREAMGDPAEALFAFKQYQSFADSINAITAREQIERVRSEYQFDIITAENDLLRRELEFSSRQNRMQLIVLLGSIFGVIITAVLLGMVIRQNNVIEAKNKDLNTVIQTRDALLGAIVHDLRSPLSSLLSALEIIREELPAGEETDLMMRIALGSGDKLREMINGLLDISGIEKEDIAAKVDMINVTDVVAQTVTASSTIAGNKNIRLEMDLQPIMAISHAEYLGRIVDNLVSNGIKFSPMGATVTIGMTKLDREWQLWVRDEGDGFSEKDKQNAFQLFQKLSTRPTNNEHSTGLGLYIVRMLTEKLHGSVRIDSEKGKGATIICTFPFKFV